MIKELSAKQKSLLTLLALLFIFFGPMIAAWSLYTSRDQMLPPTNYGQLIVPPLPFKVLALHDTDNVDFPKSVLAGKWLMVYYAPSVCDESCDQNLYKMRQVRVALGKDMDRMQRMLLTTPQPANPTLDKSLETDYLDTYHAVIAPAAMQQFLPTDFAKSVSTKGGGLFLVDPLGNVMLYYPPDADPEKLLKDLTRLLGVSQIG